MTDKTVLFSVSLLIVLLLCVLFAVSRLRKHTAQKADAERRKGAALQELNALTAKLRVEQMARDASAAPGSKETLPYGESAIGDSASGGTTRE